MQAKVKLFTLYPVEILSA